MAKTIAKCKWGQTVFYAVEIPKQPEENGMRKMRALTKGPRFERGSKVSVRHDEIIEWVDRTPDQ